MELNNIVLPQLITRRLQQTGNYERVLSDLHKHLNTLASVHHYQIGPVLNGGTSAFVAEGLNPDLEPVIITLPIEVLDFKNEMEALKIANGNGYVKLLAYFPKLKVSMVHLQAMLKRKGRNY